MIEGTQPVTPSWQQRSQDCCCCCWWQAQAVATGQTTLKRRAAIVIMANNHIERLLEPQKQMTGTFQTERSKRAVCCRRVWNRTMIRESQRGTARKLISNHPKFSGSNNVGLQRLHPRLHTPLSHTTPSIRHRWSTMQLPHTRGASLLSSMLLPIASLPSASANSMCLLM